ncbi:MAG TPA: hypothetical protein PLZ36_10685 [Armatimonadota bacterium]|nr:hypothetical protein [Armatimonadota bacterium]
MSSVCVGIVETPWGSLTCAVGLYGLVRVTFDGGAYPPLTGPWAEALAGYLARRPIPVDLPIDLAGGCWKPAGREAERYGRSSMRGNQMNFGGPSAAGFANGLGDVF